MKADLVVLVLRVTDQTPEAKDVTAGGWGALLFVALVVATVILMRSFLKQMRKTEAARQAGVFDDEPASQEPTEDEDHPTGR